MTRADKLLLAAAVAALLVGLYGRFVGLGIWPFGVDEFYISRSIDHIVRTGLPHFPCGGFYTRGLPYQYLVALIRLRGLSPELSARLVSATSSLVGLPAAYIVGRRLGGRALGLVIVITLSLSVWEIEMARFARMYAAYQAIFLWYLVYFLRYTVDRDRAALAPMVALSILGALTWEGGALLGVANLLPVLLRQERGRLRRTDWGYVAAMVLLQVALLLLTSDLRGSAPDSGDPSLDSQTDIATAGPGWILTYTAHPGWMSLLLLIIAGVAGRALAWVWSLRARWLAAATLCLALVGAIFHQFAMSVACLAVASLAGLVEPQEWKVRGARRFLLALAALALFWLAFGMATGAWRDAVEGSTTAANRWFGLAEHLAGFPNVFGEILRPWGRTMPLLTLGVLLLTGVLVVRTGLRPPDQATATRALLILLLFMMLGVGARDPGRIETRYTFFLYPLVMTLSFLSIASLIESEWGSWRSTAAVAAAVSLLFFALTEDFQPVHIAKVDSRAVNFRLGMRAALIDHYYPRSDYRALANWLTQNTRASDLVIIGIPSVDQYYHRANYFFLRDDDARYDAYACGTGPVERWTNLPLLYKTASLAAMVASGRRIVLVLYPSEAQALLADGKRNNWHEQLAWSSADHGTAVVLVNPT